MLKPNLSGDRDGLNHDNRLRVWVIVGNGEQDLGLVAGGSDSVELDFGSASKFKGWAARGLVHNAHVTAKFFIGFCAQVDIL